MPTHFLLLGAAGFMAIATLRLTDPLLPAIAADFDTTVGAVAMTVTAFTLGYGLFQLLYGPLADRLGKLRVMGCALALSAVATLACAAAGSVSALIVLRFLAGMTAGAMVPLAMAHLGDTVPYGSRQVTIGRYLSATIMGQIVGGSLPGVLVEYTSWRVVFALFGAAALVVAARLLQVGLSHTPPAAGAPGSRVTHLALLRLRNTRIIWGAVCIEGCLVLGAVPYAGAYLRHAFGLDYLTIGLVLGAFGIGGLAFSATVRWLIATLGERGMIVAGVSMVVASFALLAWAPVWQVFIPALALVGMGFFTMHNPLQIRGTEIAPQARGTAMSGFAFFLFLGQGVGVFALSYLVDGPGYAVAYALPALGVILYAGWILRTLASQRPRAPAA
jgi:predicted MFS family arabinose efflux permease